MATAASGALLSKFRGSLVGAVVGDCLGAHFEGSWHGNRNMVKSVKDFFAKLPKTEEKTKGEKKNVHTFTDDTAMARSVAASLSEKKQFDCMDMARRFTEEFYKDMFRGYGANVTAVFSKLRETNYADVFGPAKEQFDGQGSYGNGGAMRIAPAALYGNKLDDNKLIELANNITLITHSHTGALHGAILQCLAVRMALQLPLGTGLDTDEFLNKLYKYMEDLETKDCSNTDKADEQSPAPKRRMQSCDGAEKPYCKKLNKIRDFLKSEEVSRHEIDEELGTDVSALGSVPTALYSFLRCSQSGSTDIESDTPLERTIIYAVSLGGDTDTIATMAGAIAGAYYGLDSVPTHWQHICEGVSDAVQFADALYKIQEAG